MFTLLWLKDAAERAAKTAAQSALAAVGLNAVNVLAVDWAQVAGLSGGAALVSVLTSIVSAPREDTLSPASAVKQ